MSKESYFALQALVPVAMAHNVTCHDADNTVTRVTRQASPMACERVRYSPVIGYRLSAIGYRVTRIPTKNSRVAAG